MAVAAAYNAGVEESWFLPTFLLPLLLHLIIIFLLSRVLFVFRLPFPLVLLVVFRPDITTLVEWA